MSNALLRIGTRESQLAVWQATLVKNLLAEHGYPSELVYIKSEGDIDLKTPLYEMGVQGIFTRSLDIALLSNRIDIAVHSMKDVPTVLPVGIVQSAVLKRASYKDLLVHQGDVSFLNSSDTVATIATSSIRRRAQWLHKFPNHSIENLRGNVNTRLQKVRESKWQGAIFAAAGLERINLRPEASVELDWMLPAPAQGAIMVVSRHGDGYALDACSHLNHEHTAVCTKAEKDFLRTLMGGCSTPISALAEVNNGHLVFKGSIFSVDGKQHAEVEMILPLQQANNIGNEAAQQLLNNGGQSIADAIQQHAK